MITSTAALRSPETAAAPSVLRKAFAVLGCFNQDRRALSLSEIARRAALPKSTVHRVLSLLLDVGAIERTGDRYRLGIHMFAIGSCSTEAGLREIALPHLERLHRRTGQTLHLAVLHGADVLYVEKLRSVSALPCPTVAGGRLPAHCTAVGKAMLAWSGRSDPGETLVRRTTRSVTSPVALAAELDTVRRTGVAFDQEEAVVGLACVAVPVVMAGRPVTAVSVAFPAGAGTGEPMITLLRETAATIQRAIVSATTRPILDVVLPSKQGCCVQPTEPLRIPTP